MLLLIHDKAYCTVPAKGGKLLPSAAEREHTVPSVMDVPDKHALSKVLVSKHLRLDTRMRRQSVFINRAPRAPVNQPNAGPPILILFCTSVHPDPPDHQQWTERFS